MIYNDLKKIFLSIIQEEVKEEMQDKQEEEKDINTIQDFVKNYSVEKYIKDFSISFGYSKLGLEEEELEKISDIDLQSIDGIETEEKFQINNSNVMTILKYIKRRMINKMREKVYDQNNRVIILPFIIRISWKYAGIDYSLSANYSNRKLIINDYSINNSTQQVSKINRFISRRSVIKNSPFRLLGSILVYNDWIYDWDMKEMEEDLLDRKLK
jgi:hypothetical protein